MYHCFFFFSIEMIISLRFLLFQTTVYLYSIVDIQNSSQCHRGANLKFSYFLSYTRKKWRHFVYAHWFFQFYYLPYEWVNFVFRHAIAYNSEKMWRHAEEWIFFKYSKLQGGWYVASWKFVKWEIKRNGKETMFWRLIRNMLPLNIILCSFHLSV